MNKIAKERVIYNNYDLWEKYPDDEIDMIARECEWVDEDEEITDEMRNRWRYQEDEFDWDTAWNELTTFFQGKTVGFFGEIGLWHGVYRGGKIGDFETLFYKAIEDCSYIKIYDENGHMYLSCSHHDGTNCFEIKLVGDKGEEYLENWEYSWNDKRSEEYVYDQIYKRYSILPRFAQRMYGCPPREYEPITKGRLIDKLNNQARSNYCA